MCDLIALIPDHCLSVYFITKDPNLIFLGVGGGGGRERGVWGHYDQNNVRLSKEVK